MKEYILLHISGHDFPGIFSSINSILNSYSAELADVQQISTLGRLSSVLHVTVDQLKSLKLIRDIKKYCNKHNLSLDYDLVESEPIHTQSYALTVLSGKLTPQALSTLGAALASLQINIDRMHFLARKNLQCIEMIVTPQTEDENTFSNMCKTIFEVAFAHDFDAALQKESLYRRSKRLIVMDMDSTLIKQEVIDEIADFAGVKDRVSSITERAMQGEIDFNQALAERVALLKGLPVTELAKVLDRIQLTDGAMELINILKKMGFKIAIVSGGFTYFAEYFREKLGLDAAYANQLEVENGVLTGKVIGPIVNRVRKAQILRELAANEKIPLEQTVAVGDGANDLDMLAIAGLGVAFNAKPVVRSQSRAFINQPGLDVILYLLGLSEEEQQQMLAED